MTNIEECEDCESDKLNIGTSYGNSLPFSNTRCVKKPSRFQETLGELGGKASPEIQGRGRNICGSVLFLMMVLKEGSTYRQSINQFINVNTWDGVAPIIRARGSCIKRMTIKILSQ